jgi:hypothetical protein
MTPNPEDSRANAQLHRMQMIALFAILTRLLGVSEF